MTETGPWETDWIVISSEEAMDQASLFTFNHALKTFTRYEVVTRFSLKGDVRCPPYSSLSLVYPVLT